LEKTEIKESSDHNTEVDGLLLDRQAHALSDEQVQHLDSIAGIKDCGHGLLSVGTHAHSALDNIL